MPKPIYSDSNEALQATNTFYADQEGFQYTEDRVTKWTMENIKIPTQGNILDLCCGDGIWSKGFQNNNPKLELYGIDIREDIDGVPRTTAPIVVPDTGEANPSDSNSDTPGAEEAEIAVSDTGDTSDPGPSESISVIPNPKEEGTGESDTGESEKN